MRTRFPLVVSAALVAGMFFGGSTTAMAAGKHPAQAARGRQVTIKVIGFNDYHGNLQSPGTFGENVYVPAANRPAVGGADALASHVKRLKAKNRNHVVVGGGDFIGASPLISALFNDEPAVETLNRIGLDINAVGNHEFDRGSIELLRLQNGGCRIVDGVQDPNSCQGSAVGTPVPFEGAKFQWLSANVVDKASGKTLLPPYAVKRFPGARVAFIGMTLEATPTIVTPSGVAGLEFRNEADTVNALVPKLRRRGIEAIVVLIHQGGFQTSGASDINGCDGDLAQSELAKVVSRLDDAVDLVISGHTHAAYNCSASTVFVTAGNMPAGELIADAQLAVTTPSSLGGAVIAFMNPGGVRSPGFTFASSAAGEGDGNVTYGEAFTAQPFGNSLVTMTLSAQQLKNLLEQQFVGCRGQTTQRILIPSAGVKVTWDSAQACDARVRDLQLVDAGGAVVDTIVDSAGTVPTPTKTYRVTVNSFLASGGDGFTTLVGGLDPLGGAQDIDALTAYLVDFKAPERAAYDPAAAVLQKPRIARR